MYAMVFTQPDIVHVVGMLSRYMLTLGKAICTAFKRVFRYLSGMKDYAICYQGKHGDDSGKLNVHGFVDIECAGDLDRRRSTNRYVFNMFNGAISWVSKR
jgi:hypothetical protein